MEGRSEIGYFGDLFIRMHHRDSNGDPLVGHKHDKDHVTFVTSGKVRVEWQRDDGTVGAKTFIAPTYFIQDKDVMHKVVPLVDGSTWWCVFAFSESFGQPIVPDGNNPYV